MLQKMKESTEKENSKTHKLSWEGFASPWFKEFGLQINTAFLTNTLESFLDLCY